MAENVLQSEARTSAGKGTSRRLRASGSIPAVVYGRGKDTVSIAVDPKNLERVLHSSGLGMNTLIDLAVEDEVHVVLVKELQRGPVRGEYLHVDFYEVEMTQQVEVSVPIRFTGRPAGVELGGILEHPLRELEISCLPGSIPESIEADVSAMEIGDSLHVSDLVVPDDVTVLSELALSVANVEAPVAADEEPETEEGAEGEVPVEGEAGEASTDQGVKEAPVEGS